MKVIDVPTAAKVKLFESDEEREISFKKFLLDAIDVHEEFGRGFAGVRQGVKIVKLVEEANGSIALEDADFDALKRAVEGCKWKVPVARAAERAGFLAAFEKAQAVTTPTGK